VSQRRTLILVAAIAIGALASFLVWNYVNGVQDEAYSGAERVPVYLVKQQVPRGMEGTEAQAYIVKENIPRKFKPSNAIVNLEDIAGKVAMNNLVPNQVVVSDMFVEVSDPRAQQSFTERLKKISGEDQVAISVQLDDVRGVSGLIQPGDYVNILNVAPASTGTEGSASCARMLYQKVMVLAVDKSAVPMAGEAAAAPAEGEAPAAASTSSGLVTLIVPAEASTYIASYVDSLYFSLVAPDYEPKEIAPCDPSLAPGEDPGIRTPYGPEGDQSAT
jgi:pilus assembly protein CpaB